MNAIARRLALAVALFAATGSVGVASPQCQVPPDLQPDWPQLEHTKLQVRQGKPLQILAMGSSSTLGEAASVPGSAWPAQLRAELAARLPGVAVEVVNKARRRQLAAQMLARLDEDVAAVKPNLVIWESGTAEAVRGDDVETYRAVLLEGIERLHGRGIDVILIDMQFARGPAALINFDPYRSVVQEAAEMQGAAYFPRFAIMRDWVEKGSFVLEDLTRAEQAKVADAVYACIAGLLAEGITRAVR